MSRGVFREAVRILEHQHVVEMRRGPGVGLIVMAPDAGALTSAAVLYFTYRNVSNTSLFETRMALELSVVEAVTTTVDAAGLQTLAIAIGRDRSQHGGRHTHEFHYELAKLSGNPVSELFSEMLVNLTEQHVALGIDGRDLTPTEMTRTAEQAHRAILDAIADGDVDAARRRMSRHIAALQGVMETEFPLEVGDAN